MTAKLVAPDAGPVGELRDGRRTQSRFKWLRAFAVAAGVTLVLGGCEGDQRDGAEQGAGTEPAVQPTPPSTPSVTDLDYLLDLEIGAMTPLPKSIREGEGYAISPDGSEVAYYGGAEDGSRQVEVFIAYLDGTHVRQITHERSPKAGVARSSLGSLGWSPDGTKIAYVGRPNLGVKRNVFVIDLASGVSTQVTFETVHVSDAQFSPDGSSIVYTAHLAGGSQVRTVPATGGEGSRLVGGRGSSASGASLSPDGSLLSYICRNPAPSPIGEMHLCLANANGSDHMVIARAGSGDWIDSGSWSPDGSQLAFGRHQAEQVYLIDVTTGDRTLGPTGGWPSWVDDHTLIVEDVTLH